MEIKEINRLLKDHFGVAWNGEPIWRVVWSEEQFEKRLTNYTDAGIALLIPEVRELPKYRQWIHNKYVLEQLTAIPEINKDELPTAKISYEPIYVFENARGEALPPKFEAAKFIIDSLNAARGQDSMVKYVDEDKNHPIERREMRIQKLQEELFGNETDVGDALAHKQGIVVP